MKSYAIVDALYATFVFFFKYLICSKVSEIGIIKFNVISIIPWIVLLLLLVFNGLLRTGNVLYRCLIACVINDEQAF